MAIAVAATVATPCHAVDVWITSGDKSRLLSQQPDVVFEPGVGGSGTVISVNASQRFQTIEGYGAAMTNSSAWLIQNKLNAAQRDRMMQDLFAGEDGIGLNYLRLAIGASDFTADGFYTYNDLPFGQTDPNQTNFSIDPDRAPILPSLDQVRGVNPDLLLMASPWSAPGWMKTSGSVIGGSLAPQFEASYSTYLRKFVEAYAAEGHPIDALTLQNEPLHEPNNYPGMTMSVQQQIDLVKNHVGPDFAAAGLDTKLLAYDHNWDEPQYPIDVLNDPDARQYLAGSAFHGYAGDVSAQSIVRNAHPDKGIYFTEITGGDFAPNFEDNLVFNARNLLIGNARNWGKTTLLWNLALDENNGPHLGGCTTCRGVVTIDSNTGDITHNEEFYSLGHASQFVRPGAVRIGSTSIGNLVETVAFENPDGSRAMIALNPTQSTQAIRAFDGQKHFRYEIPARSVATFTWEQDDRADFDNGGFELGGYEATGGSLDGWLPWGVTGGNVGVTDALSLTGDNALRLSEPAGFGGFSGVSQGISVIGGDRVVIDASVLLPDDGSIAGTGSSVLMKVEFYNEYDGQFQSADFLGQTEIVVADGTTAAGDWTAHQIEELVPDGAVEAR
ncbi:MAG: glycoside hydrolase family 30 beta sandwich domain-containing protein, partial [Planctomycetota bacterium]